LNALRETFPNSQEAGQSHDTDSCETTLVVNRIALIREEIQGQNLASPESAGILPSEDASSVLPEAVTTWWHMS